MVEPLKKKNMYTNYNGEVFSPTNVENIDLYNALATISQQLGDIKHQHVEPPEPKPVDKSLKEAFDEEPKGLIDSLTQLRFSEVVNYYYRKMNDEILTGKPGDNADEVLPIKAVPNSEYIKALLLREMGREPGLKSLGFDKRLRMTGYTTAIIDEVQSSRDVAILVEDLGHKDYVNSKSQDVDIKNDILTFNACLSGGLPYHIVMVDNSVDLYKNKDLIKQLAQQYKVITFSDIK